MNRYDELTDEQRATLHALGGGPPDRIAGASVAQPKEEPPKRYGPHDITPNLWRCAECDDVINMATGQWPEPLCITHYLATVARPPRVVLTFADGHREMRRNYVAPTIYRDVTEFGEDVRVAWFERVSEQREGDKLVMQFYRQIEQPVTALGKPKTAMVKARPSWWVRFKRWVRLQWFIMGGA